MCSSEEQIIKPEGQVDEYSQMWYKKANIWKEILDNVKDIFIISNPDNRNSKWIEWKE